VILWFPNNLTHPETTSKTLDTFVFSLWFPSWPAFPQTHFRQAELGRLRLGRDCWGIRGGNRVKILAIGFALLALLLIYVASQTDDQLTTEYIRHGDGVEYLDSRPLNQGGTWARGPETDWERRKRRNDNVSALGGLCFLLVIYFWWKHWVQPFW